MSNRKIMIVFEETGEDSRDAEGHPGKKFNVYLSGEDLRDQQIMRNGSAPLQEERTTS